jgi:hypothetical protein
VFAEVVGSSARHHEVSCVRFEALCGNEVHLLRGLSVGVSHGTVAENDGLVGC